MLNVTRKQILSISIYFHWVALVQQLHTKNKWEKNWKKQWKQFDMKMLLSLIGQVKGKQIRYTQRTITSLLDFWSLLPFIVPTTCVCHCSHFLPVSFTNHFFFSKSTVKSHRCYFARGIWNIGINWKDPLT